MWSEVGNTSDKMVPAYLKVVECTSPLEKQLTSGQNSELQIL